MRIIRYIASGGREAAVGIITNGDTVAEVPGSGGDLGPLALLDNTGLEQVASASITHHELNNVRLLPPVGQPGKILMLAANYHHTDIRNDINLEIETPEFFSKPTTALLAHEEVIPYNALTVHQVEEIELGVVIGKPGKNISPENAFDHIFGYTVINDVSARKLDFSPDRANEARKGWYDWLNGKWLDGYCPTGPWIVPKSDLPDVSNLRLTTKVNGEIRIDSNTNRMIYNIPRQIEYISSLCTLQPGDLISTGVALGLAGAEETYLKTGDVIEGTVEGVGTLRNTVAGSS